MIESILSSSRALAAVLLMAAALPALAQAGHPVKGSWSGYWGTDAQHAHHMLLEMDWVNHQIVGTINPGPHAVKIEQADLNAASWTLTIKAMMPTQKGGKKPWVATGTLENLGSWTNRRYVGTYRFGDETGNFVVAIN